MTALVKKSLSLPAEVWAAAEAEAVAEHTTLSAFVAEAVARYVAIRAGQRAVREWEREHGALTASELAEADEALDRAGVERQAWQD